MPGKCRPSLMAKTLGNVMTANLSYTDKRCVQAVFERFRTDEQIVDKIASYLEREENWLRLKHQCWMIDDRSDELRELLHEALKGEEKTDETADVRNLLLECVCR